MKETRLFNKLMLSQCPLSNFDFSYLKSEKLLLDILEQSNIYMIVQRPVLYLQNLYVDHSNCKRPLMKFQIKQKGTENTLQCEFPFRQQALGNTESEKILFHFCVDYEFQQAKQSDPPFNHIINMLIYTQEDGYGNWFSPEKLLFDFWNERIELEIKGDIQGFLNYNVHYIGKATEEHVIKRLTGHEHLQDVLSTEMPFQYGGLPTDEIVLLFFEFSDNIHLAMLEDDDLTEELFEQMKSGNLPTVPEKAIYHDAEKALIHAFNPKHNKVIYKHYPNGKQNLFEHNDLKAYTYSFLDPITLIFNEKSIMGSRDFFDTDMLLVKHGEPLTILKASERN